MNKLLLTSVITLIPFISYGEQTPLAHKDDARIKYVNYQVNNVVKLKASTFAATQILFGEKESILAVEGGDTSSWMVTYHEHLPNMIFIKPTALNSNTNMTVVTNKHNYYFNVSSNTHLMGKPSHPVYAIKFNYPEEERAQKENQRKEALLQKASLKKNKDKKQFNWNYRFSGNSQIRPVHVYDDGQFTYFELNKNQPVPAIFAVEDSQGKEAIVNTRRQGDTLIVHRLAPQFTLRNGSLIASVFNSNEIARIKQGR